MPLHGQTSWYSRYSIRLLCTLTCFQDYGKRCFVHQKSITFLNNKILCITVLALHQSKFSAAEGGLTITLDIVHVLSILELLHTPRNIWVIVLNIPLNSASVPKQIEKFSHHHHHHYKFIFNLFPLTSYSCFIMALVRFPE